MVLSRLRFSLVDVLMIPSHGKPWFFELAFGSGTVSVEVRGLLKLLIKLPVTLNWAMDLWPPDSFKLIKALVSSHASIGKSITYRIPGHLGLRQAFTCDLVASDWVTVRAWTIGTLDPWKHYVGCLSPFSRYLCLKILKWTVNSTKKKKAETQVINSIEIQRQAI